MSSLNNSKTFPEDINDEVEEGEVRVDTTTPDKNLVPLQTKGKGKRKETRKRRRKVSSDSDGSSFGRDDKKEVIVIKRVRVKNEKDDNDSDTRERSRNFSTNNEIKVKKMKLDEKKIRDEFPDKQKCRNLFTFGACDLINNCTYSHTNFENEKQLRRFLEDNELYLLENYRKKGLPGEIGPAFLTFIQEKLRKDPMYLENRGGPLSMGGRFVKGPNGLI